MRTGVGRKRSSGDPRRSKENRRAQVIDQHGHVVIQARIPNDDREPPTSARTPAAPHWHVIPGKVAAFDILYKPRPATVNEERSGFNSRSRVGRHGFGFSEKVTDRRSLILGCWGRLCSNPPFGELVVDHAVRMLILVARKNTDSLCGRSRMKTSGFASGAIPWPRVTVSAPMPEHAGPG